MTTSVQTVRQILEDGQPGFAEVVLEVATTGSTSEVYTMYEDLRFTSDGKIVTFMAHGGTHLHLKLDQVREVRFIHKMNDRGQPSYQVHFIDQAQRPMLKVYLRKSDKPETNPLRHDLFMRLKEKYGERVALNT
jgi:putative heme iron utilization protein